MPDPQSQGPMTPPPDPSGGAVPDVNPSWKERILGAPGLQGQETPLSKAMNWEHQMRLSTARRSYANMKTAATELGMGDIDPQTGKPTGMHLDPQTGERRAMTPQERALREIDYEGAKKDYHKSVGGDKDSKEQLEQHQGIFDLLVNKGHEALQTVVGAHKKLTGGGGDKNVPPPPSPSGVSADTGGGAAGAAAATGPAALPPPPAPPPPAPASGPTPRDNFRMMAPDIQNRLAENQTLEFDKRKQKIATDAKIAEEEANAKAYAMYRRHMQHVPITDPTTGNTVMGSYDPVSGEYLDQDNNVIKNAQMAGKPFHYSDPQTGEPLIGFMVGTKLQDQEGKPLPPGTQVFSAWMQPLTTTTDSYKSEPQPDGTIKLVPVETTSTRTRGKAASSPSTPPSPSASSGANGTNGAGGAPAPAKGGGSRTVGGKVPPQVAKAYDAFNGSTERFNVMTKALDPALHGDQQAMINLLANHMGMTMGLQKGARMNQALIEESMHSTPWLAGIKARFDDRGYLTGVTLTPDQMHKMIDLAKVRLDEDHDAWQREIGAAKTGYGMSSPPTPSASKSASASKPTNAADYLKSIGH